LFCPTGSSEVVPSKAVGECHGNDEHGGADPRLAKEVDGQVNDLQEEDGKVCDTEQELSSKSLILVGLATVVERY